MKGAIAFLGLMRGSTCLSNLSRFWWGIRHYIIWPRRIVNIKYERTDCFHRFDAGQHIFVEFELILVRQSALYYLVASYCQLQIWKDRLLTSGWCGAAYICRLSVYFGEEIGLISNFFDRFPPCKLSKAIVHRMISRLYGDGGVPANSKFWRIHDLICFEGVCYRFGQGFISYQGTSKKIDHQLRGKDIFDSIIELQSRNFTKILILLVNLFWFRSNSDFF